MISDNDSTPDKQVISKDYLTSPDIDGLTLERYFEDNSLVIWLTENEYSNHMWTLSESEAMWLRDSLMKLFPPETAPSIPRSKLLDSLTTDNPIPDPLQYFKGE